jgi:hypothetical protein
MALKVTIQILFMIFFFFLAVLGFELGALCLPGRHSTIQSTPLDSFHEIGKK